MTAFSSLGLPEAINQSLSRMNFETATPIQARTIPVAIEGRDILGSAQTGTGKTAAFVIPMIARLMQDPKSKGLIVAPTRELASQILDVVRKLADGQRGMKTALLIGGDSMGKQFAQLRDRPRIIIGTPGRINDHLRRDDELLQDVCFVAIDEADRMLDMGFSVQLDEILRLVPDNRQTLMFSATFPEEIIRFSKQYLKNPERISVNPEAVSAPRINHEVKHTSGETKYTDLLAELEARDGSVIIFVKTQHGTEKLAKKLENSDHPAIAIHGGLRQNQRDKAVRNFRQQKIRILVATDVASRGLDIPHIEHVINYDMPQVAEDYIHRIGRTARAGAQGNAVAFVMSSDRMMWNAINRLMNPGEKPERAPRGADARPNRGGFAGKSKDRGFSSKRPPRRDNDQSYAPRKSAEDRPAAKPFRKDDRKPFAGKKPAGSFQDRDARPARSGDYKPSPRKRHEDGPQDREAKQSRSGDFKPYAKKPYDRKDRAERSDRNDRYDRGEKRERKERNDNRPARDERAHGGNKKTYVRYGQESDRPRAKRAPSDPHWNAKEGRKPYKPKSEQGGEDSGRDRRGAEPRNRREDGSKPPRKPAAPAKKPFKFKEHSRKPARARTKQA